MSTLLCVLFAFIIAFITFIINRRKNKKYWDQVAVYYEDKPLPLIGNAHLFRNGEEFLWRTFDLSRRAGYATYKFTIGNVVFINLCEPETVEALLSSNKEIVKSTEYTFFKEWLGDGLLFSAGNKWRQRRKIITPTFHFKILEQFVKVFNDNGDIFIKEISKDENKLLNVYPFVTFYTLDVISESAMGVKINAQIDKNSEYAKAICSIMELVKKRTLSPFKRFSWIFRLSNDFVQYTKDMRVIHNLTRKVIQTRKDALKDKIDVAKNGGAVETEDDKMGIRKKIAFLDMLLLSKLPDASFLSDEDIREEVDTFMFEGQETVASCICFTLYSLTEYPKIQQKVLEEITSIVGVDPNTDITYQHLQDMKYLEMVIKETLRLYPSVPYYGREMQDDFMLPDGRIIPKGCRAAVDMFSLGRNPRFFENPEHFDPERFSTTNAGKRNPFTYVPFSAGSRNCIGQKFAMLEVKSIVSKILLNYELIHGGQGTEPRLTSELTLKTVSGVNICIRKNKNIRNS